MKEYIKISALKEVRDTEATNCQNLLTQKHLTNRRLWSIITENLNITNNDYDEDGRIEEPGESWRLLRANGKAFQ